MAYNQLCRNHELHYANSSTSFHDFIHFISRVHLLHWVDTYGCGGWRRRLSWQNETAALAEGVECSGWRRRMQWPEETNAVAGGDTFWTLITRDCGIILNWVHLKKSRIIFFVIVTYWQSMARFRKNDFFKWAQKIKSVFCFIPHTHEGCDFTIRVYHKVLVVSIHTPTKGVTLEHEGCPATFCCFNPHTHEGCDGMSLSSP